MKPPERNFGGFYKGKSMDVKSAVKEKAQYADIVAWFDSLGDLNPEQMKLLADTIEEMSEEIYEHYRALCDILKEQLMRVKRICREEGCKKAYPEEAARGHLLYALTVACEKKAVLAETYEELAEEMAGNERK